jgi:hypothetical protein
MALCREAKFYHNQVESSESAKLVILYEVKLRIVLALKPELSKCYTQPTVNTQSSLKLMIFLEKCIKT